MCGKHHPVTADNPIATAVASAGKAFSRTVNFPLQLLSARFALSAPFDRRICNRISQTKAPTYTTTVTSNSVMLGALNRAAEQELCPEAVNKALFFKLKMFPHILREKISVTSPLWSTRLAVTATHGSVPPKEKSIVLN